MVHLGRSHVPRRADLRMGTMLPWAASLRPVFQASGRLFCGVDGDIRGCVRGSFASSNRGRLGCVGGPDG